MEKQYYNPNIWDYRDLHLTGSTITAQLPACSEEVITGSPDVPCSNELRTEMQHSFQEYCPALRTIQFANRMIAADGGRYHAAASINNGTEPQIPSPSSGLSACYAQRGAVSGGISGTEPQIRRNKPQIHSPPAEFEVKQVFFHHNSI